MRALVLKEIRSFFSSLLGYTVVAVFLLFTSLFLWLFPGGWNILDGGMATLDPFFAMAPWVLMFLIPAITMRSFAEEHRAGTLELLLTRPLTEGQVVLAKFLGAWAVSIAALLPTLSFVLVVGMLGLPAWNLDLGAVWGSYLGLIVFSGALTGIGVVASSCTMQPLVAFLSAMLTSIVVYFGFGALADFAWLGSWEHAFVQLGMESPFRRHEPWSFGFAGRPVFRSVDGAFGAGVSFCLGAAQGACASGGHGFVALDCGLGGGDCAEPVGARRRRFDGRKAAHLGGGHSRPSGGLAGRRARDVLPDRGVAAEWKRLESEVESLLQRMAQASGGRLAFQFVDIYDIDDAQTIGQNEQALFEQGLEFTRIAFEDNGRQAFQTIWPGAMISFRGEESPVQFFGSEIPQADQAMIQGSINTLEFNLASGIRNSTAFESKSIAILEGHGELEDLAMIDLVSTLEEDHLVARVELDGRLNVLSEKLEGMRYRTNRYDLLIVAKPDSVFPEKDKVILDQFLMNGGRILWMVDPVLTDLDNLRQTKETFGVENQIGLYDQLFDYGVRLNRNLIIDPQCAPILLDAGPMGNQRNMQLFNWYFAPLSMPLGTGHPITNNLDPIHFDFVSSMDLVNTQEDVTSTMLLTSSERAKTYRVPVRISSGIVDLDPAYFAEETPRMLASLRCSREPSVHTTRKPCRVPCATMQTSRSVRRVPPQPWWSSPTGTWRETASVRMGASCPWATTATQDGLCTTTKNSCSTPSITCFRKTHSSVSDREAFNFVRWTTPAFGRNAADGNSWLWACRCSW